MWKDQEKKKPKINWKKKREMRRTEAKNRSSHWHCSVKKWVLEKTPRL